MPVGLYHKGGGKLQRQRETPQRKERELYMGGKKGKGERNSFKGENYYLVNLTWSTCCGCGSQRAFTNCICLLELESLCGKPTISKFPSPTADEEIQPTT